MLEPTRRHRVQVQWREEGAFVFACELQIELQTTDLF